MAEIIDGKRIAEEVTAKVRAATATLAGTQLIPGIAVVIVGDDAASHVYVKSKSRQAKECGFHSVQHSLPEETSEEDLVALVEGLNRDPSIHGILVQLPLPKHMDEDRVIQTILPEKDVDGFNFINVGRLGAGKLKNAMVPCTPAGCMILISRIRGHDLSGLSAVVIGRSNIVGRPLANLLLAANATVTVAHSRTGDLASVVRGADIVVAAVGQPELIKGDWIKPGATIIDVGISRIPAPEKGEGKTRLVGDVAFAEAEKVAGAITPVPGGVGPMTIAMLMAGTLRAACLSIGQEPPEL